MFGTSIGDESVRRVLLLTAVVIMPAALVCRAIPSLQRLFISFAYFISATFLMACVSALVWYRNPAGMAPLPDIMHDLLPFVDELSLPAFGVIPGHKLPDFFIALLLSATMLFILSRPQRATIARRFFTVYATLMLMRCVTIVVTSLPDALPICHTLTPGTQRFVDINIRAVILKAIRMVVPLAGHTPEMTCGDMVFSGHSTILVICGLVWHTYHRRVDGFNLIKTGVWLLASCGLISILVVRLHYTIDVLLALFLTISVWTSYHRFAEDVIRGHQFTMIYFFDATVLYPAVRWLEHDLIPVAVVAQTDKTPLTRSNSKFFK